MERDEDERESWLSRSILPVVGSQIQEVSAVLLAVKRFRKTYDRKQKLEMPVHGRKAAAVELGGRLGFIISPRLYNRLTCSPSSKDGSA